MKANCRALRLSHVPAALVLLIAACTEPHPSPTGGRAPLPSRPPPAVALPSPAPAPLFIPMPKQSNDWRDAPATEGDWRWALEDGASVARFASPAAATLVELRCDRPAGVVRLRRAASAAESAPLTVITTSTTRVLSAATDGGPGPVLAAALPVRDPLLDAIAFSRGRFALDAPGTAPLYLPSWPEISRVIEDCRGG
ncbi:MAG: hypothetical protein JF593_12335 [Novosphingobium sp.]|nr:hypothetical protein [Novosphingobium sp.]